MARGLYSESHDKDKHPKRSAGKQKRQPLVAASPPSESIVFAPAQLTEEQRQRLRQMQLQQSGRVAKPVQDVRRKQKMPGGPGSDGSVLPEFIGAPQSQHPQPFRRKLQVLPNDGDPNMKRPVETVEDRKKRWRRTFKRKQGRAASDLDATDPGLHSLERNLQDALDAVQMVEQDIEAIQQAVQQVGSPELSKALDNMRSVFTDVIHAGLLWVDDNFSTIKKQTYQALEVNKGQKPEDQDAESGEELTDQDFFDHSVSDDDLSEYSIDDLETDEEEEAR